MRGICKILLFFFVLLALFFKAQNADLALSSPTLVISNPTPSSTQVTYRFQFITGTSLSENQRITLNFPPAYPSPITLATNVTCPPNMTASVNERMIICTVLPGRVHPATTTEIIARGITNPGKENPPGVADIHAITIMTDANESDVVAAIINEGVSVRTRLEPFLNFEVRGVAAGELFNNSTTTSSTTANSISFGEDIPVNSPILVAHDLFVKTNAARGFMVNIYQNDDLKSGDNKIYCFDNGNCRNFTQAREWLMPSGFLGFPNTYGHFGVSSSDSSLGPDCLQNYYGVGGPTKWAGLVVGQPTEIMRHCRPADGITQGEGWARVGFQLEISILQPNGLYQTEFTYVITPTF